MKDWSKRRAVSLIEVSVLSDFTALMMPPQAINEALAAKQLCHALWEQKASQSLVNHLLLLYTQVETIKSHDASHVACIRTRYACVRVK